AGPYWEAVGWEGAVPLSPPTQQEGLLGLSPSLLASPPPPGPPDEVIRGVFGDQRGGIWTMSVCSPAQGHCHPPALFADIYLSPQAPAVAPHEAVADGSTVTPRVAAGMGGTPQGQRGRGQGAPARQKKKCVNGFIMFCCMNRKPYMSTHPGLPSTVVTRELAQLWRSLSPRERRPYCLRARRFNRLHDRMMRPERDGDGDKDDDGD
ncbi:BHMG1 protein, partial [Psilopogon haemacephalus]|nr:BHMG1 protein [Psilopogon haemacephalus]